MTEHPTDQPPPPQPPAGPLGGLLHAYDREVQEAMDAALAADTGTGRVRAMHDRLAPALAVHDAVLSSALCPILDTLPDGPDVADRVRTGCRRRGRALRRLDRVTRGVAPHNVYGASGDEIDDVLEALDQSFRAHQAEESDAIAGVLTAAGGAVDADMVADRMETAARRAPTRPHGRPGGAPPTMLALAAWRQRDRLADWVDAHHGWAEAGHAAPSPRRRQIAALQDLALGAPATVRGVLSAYDETVGGELAGLEQAQTDAQRAEATHRVMAAVAIHDAVVEGVVCPLLQSVPGGADLAAVLRWQCRERADLMRTWTRMARRTPAEDLYREDRVAVDAVIGSLAASFAAHEDDETASVDALLRDLPPQRYRGATAPFADSMWPWHSEGPNVLALQMARWADRSPTRPHALCERHPSSRVLRTSYGLVDHLRDRWHDTPLTRWLFPPREEHPFSEQRHATAARREDQPAAEAPPEAPTPPGAP